MTGFDAELYLRLMGESTIVDAEFGDSDNVDPELAQAAAALVVGGAIDERRATEITHSYSFAQELVRNPALAERLAQVRWRLASGDPPDLEARRVFTPDTVLRLPIGRLRVGSVALTEGRTAIEGELMIASGATAPQGQGPSLTFSTAGQSAPTHFSGDLQEGIAAGLWECSLTLLSSTTWLEVDGCRLDLGSVRPVPQFVAQALEVKGRLQRFLWLHVLGWRGTWEEEPHTAVTALRAAGLLAIDEPGVPTAPGWRWGATSRLEPVGADDWLQRIDVSVTVPSDFPVAVLSRQGRRLGRGGMIGIGAVSPRFDGVMVAIDSLSVGADGVSLEVEVSGASQTHHLSAVGPLGVKPIAWWISDEHGSRRYGTISGSSGNHLLTRAKVVFGQLPGEPALLTITVATPDAAAAIAIPLRWR